MAEREPPDLGFNGPASSRVYDFSLGGKDNYAQDREVAAAALAAHKVAYLLPRENRKFMRRAVRHLLNAGVRQFLDIGCGLPGNGNVHQVVHQTDPQGKTVYIDHDPVAVVHYQSLLHSIPTATAIRADARKPQELLTHPELTQLIDLTQPVAVLMVSVLSHIRDGEDPEAIVAEFRAALPPGGHLAICDLLGDDLTEADWAAHHDLVERYGIVLTFRSRQRFTGFFDGLDLVEPGLVLAPEWRPDRPYDPPSGWLVAGIGRKPAEDGKM